MSSNTTKERTPLRLKLPYSMCPITSRNKGSIEVAFYSVYIKRKLRRCQITSQRLTSIVIYVTELFTLVRVVIYSTEEKLRFDKTTSNDVSFQLLRWVLFRMTSTFQYAQSEQLKKQLRGSGVCQRCESARTCVRRTDTYSSADQHAALEESICDLRSRV